MQGSKHVDAGELPVSSSKRTGSSTWMLAVLLIGSGCAQPSQEKRPGFVRPPPPILKDAGFVVPDDDEGVTGDGDGDGPPYDDEVDDSGTGGPSDSGSHLQVDAHVAPSDAGPVGCAQTTCGASCVDLNTSSQNCGMCGHKCPGGAACSGGTCGSPSNDCTYQSREGHDYLFCSNDSTWKEARAHCKDFGLDLVIIADENENNFVKGTEARWIGAVNNRKEAFHWVVPGGGTNGAQVSYAPWNDNEPNDDGSCLIPVVGPCTYEDCAEILASGKWNDAYCDKSDTKEHYVCESY